MGLNCYLGLIKILQIRFLIDRAFSSIDRTRQILKSFFCNLDALVCSRFANCSKLLEPNKYGEIRILANVPFKDISMERVKVKEFGESKDKDYG